MGNHVASFLCGVKSGRNKSEGFGLAKLRHSAASCNHYIWVFWRVGYVNGEPVCVNSFSFSNNCLLNMTNRGLRDINRGFLPAHRGGAYFGKPYFNIFEL